MPHTLTYTCTKCTEANNDKAFRAVAVAVNRLKEKADYLSVGAMAYLETDENFYRKQFLKLIYFNLKAVEQAAAEFRASTENADLGANKKES